jgi:endoglucanase
MNSDLLKKICSVKGASSEEDKIAEFILDEIKDLVDEHSIDALGNLIARKKGSGKKMMLAGHMDQIGMMVTFIDKEGFIHFTTIGGMNPTVIHSCRVIFNNGTTGIVSAERLEDPNKLAIDKMFIDIGATSKEEAEKYVSIGDICVFSGEPIIDDMKVMTPYLDDRIGCFIMIEALKKLKKPAFDVYFVFTVQEEVGLMGAKTAAYTIDPDYGISFDVTNSADTPKCRKLPQKFDGGAAIKLKDKSLLCHPIIIKHMEKCAKDANIKHQFEILELGGTDSGAIHVNKGGVPSGVISVPTRHIHSMNEMARLSDIQDCIDLAVKVLETEIS